MPTPQFNMRMPPETHAGLREIAEALRRNPALEERLVDICRQDAADSLAPNAGTADSANGQRLDQIEQRLDRIEAWLTSGGMRRAPPGGTAPSGSGVRVGMLPKAVRG